MSTSTTHSRTVEIVALVSLTIGAAEVAVGESVIVPWAQAAALISRGEARRPEPHQQEE